MVSVIGRKVITLPPGYIGRSVPEKRVPIQSGLVTWEEYTLAPQQPTSLLISPFIGASFTFTNLNFVFNKLRQQINTFILRGYKP
jgi:hypothetical protein